MQITYNNPSYPPGTEIGVHCLGILINGQAVEIGEEELAAFAVEKNMPIDQALATIPFTQFYAIPPVEVEAPQADTPEVVEGGE
jgi:hypothetical protein